jgi:succinyl-diaminopimelate desuccinylase
MSLTDPSTSLPAVSVERCRQLLTELISIPSVVGDATRAHEWVTARLRELGMSVSQYAVEGRSAPLVLGVLEGEGDGPGVMFDAHFDTVHARPEDWSHDPWAADIVDGVLFGRGAVDSKGSHVAMLTAIEAVVASGAPRSGPIYFMSDSDGEDGFRGAGLLADLGVTERVDTVFSAEATSNFGIEIAYPGISTWKITAVGRTAHPTEPEKGINAITKMAKLIEAVDAGRLQTPRGSSDWFEPRVTLQAIRTLPGSGWTIPARCDAVISVMSPAGTTLTEVEDSIKAFLRALELEDGEVRFDLKVLPMGAGRLWLRPGEADPQAPGVSALEEAVEEVRGVRGEVRRFNGGWVDAVELMRTGPDGYGAPAVVTFGPGDFEQAHNVDERIRLTDVAEAGDIYARALLSLLSR